MRLVLRYREEEIFLKIREKEGGVGGLGPGFGFQGAKGEMKNWTRLCVTFALPLAASVIHFSQ